MSAKPARQYDLARGNSSQRGYDAAWQRCRKLYLAHNPLCMDCGERKRLTVATEAHHVQKVADAPELRLAWSNLRALCKSCHSARTQRGE